MGDVLLAVADLSHNINLVSFIFGQLFIAHYAFSFGEKNDELYQLATFLRNCTYYPKPRRIIHSVLEKTRIWYGFSDQKDRVSVVTQNEYDLSPTPKSAGK